MSTIPMTEPASAAVGRAPKFDFPAWLPPMLVKELRQGLRTRGFVAAFMVLQAVMLIAFLWAFTTQSLFNSSGAADSIFWITTGLAVLFVTPLRGLASLRAELDSHTLDLLLLTPLTARRIVLGKWISLMAQAGLLVLALLPYGVVRYFFGSVDLLRDLGVLALMYGAGGVLTAAALWVSGLPKIFRILVPIGMVLMLQSIPAMLISMSFGARPFGRMTLTGGDAPLILGMWVFNGAVLLVFFIIQAVRRIAPPSDNLSVASRLLPLVLMLGALPIAWPINEPDFANAQLVIALIGLSLVTAMEMSNIAGPMAVHVRNLVTGSLWKRLTARFLLPGWQSAAIYSAVWLSLIALIAYCGAFKLGHDKMLRFIWLMVLLWQLIVFPAFLVSFFRKIGRQSGTFYFFFHAVCGLLAALANVSMTELPYGTLRSLIDFLCHTLPVSSFWYGVELREGDYGDYWILQGAVLVAMITLVWLRSRPYWQNVRVMRFLAEKRADEITNA